MVLKRQRSLKDKIAEKAGEELIESKEVKTVKKKKVVKKKKSKKGK